MCLTSAIIILTKDYSPRIYLDNQEIIGLVSGVLIIVGLFQVADGLQAVALGMLRGLQDVRVPTASTFMAYWLLAIPFGRYLAFETDWHLKGIWIGLLVGLYISAFFLLLRFHQITKKKIKELAS
jgi:MATE family multidrug resistance protein